MKYYLCATITLSGNAKYSDNNINTLEQIYKWRKNIHLKKINAFSSGIFFALMLIFYSKYDNKLDKYIIPKSFYKNFRETTDIFYNISKNTSIFTSMPVMCKKLSNYITDDILVKINDLLTIVYCRISNDGIIEQVKCNKFKSKSQLLELMYKSMSIPLITAPQILCDDKYIYCDGFTFIDKLQELKKDEVHIYSIFKISSGCVFQNCLNFGITHDNDIVGGTLYYNASDFLYEPLTGCKIPLTNYLPNCLNNKWNFGYSQGIYTYGAIKIIIYTYYSLPYIQKISSCIFNNFGWLVGFKKITNINHLI